MFATWLAQVAPSVPGAPPVDINAWLGQIAQYGLLGVMFLLVGYALYKRDKDLTAERAARLADALAMRNLIEADTAAKVAAIKLQEEHNRLQETVARNQELIATRVGELIGRKP
jgi:replication initiation and membrane attachment protein DnaB